MGDTGKNIHTRVRVKHIHSIKNTQIKSATYGKIITNVIE
jgi:hypothetical protein